MLGDAIINASAVNVLSKAFAADLPLRDTLEPNLRKALGHVLETPGSLVRPQLAVQMALCYGLPETAASDLAIALEYFHTASLLFDDLPCMDDAVLRRGAPCTHQVYGEATAILASLGLINRAYGLAWRAVSICPSGSQQDALIYLEQCLGVEGLLDGQSFDLHCANLSLDREAVEAIATRKTVSMVRLALVLPALLGRAPEREIALLEGLSQRWGLGYQILDDLKDVLDSEAETGKTAARDALLSRPNIALSIGVPAAIERLFELTDEGDELLLQLLAARPCAAFLERFCDDLKEETARVTHRACQPAGQNRA